jgi:drug/metabolite transporter (DMT)-like permease
MPMSNEQQGVLWGIVGVAAFSLTLPMTRVAVPEMGVPFVMLGRAAGAGLIAALILLATRQSWPARSDWRPLLITGAGVVIGFPLLTTIAMSMLPASKGAVVVALLPLSTAIGGVLVAGERPSAGFWVASVAGTMAVLAFLFLGTGPSIGVADLALLAAVVAAAIGYAFGGHLAARLGGWQTICWTLVFALPLILIVSAMMALRPTAAFPNAASWQAWSAFAYVTLVSQLTGFFAWYRGLALGGIARVSQTQLLQLFFSLLAAAALLGETIDPRMLVYGTLVVVAAAIGTRLRIKRKPAEPVNSRV